MVDNQKVLDHNLSQEPEIGSSDLHEQRPSAVLATGGLRVEKGIEQELGHGRVGDDRGSRSREYRLEERSRTESIDIIPRLTDHHDNATLREVGIYSPTYVVQYLCGIAAADRLRADSRNHKRDKRHLHIDSPVFMSISG